MFTAIVWIGSHGSSSQGGFASAEAANDAAEKRIADGTHGKRDDLVSEVRDASNAPVYFAGIPVLRAVAL